MTPKSSTFRLEDILPLYARAYRDLHQHPDALKTAPESGSRMDRIDAGFHRPHFEGQNGVLEMAHRSTVIQIPSSYPAHQPARLILHI